MRDKHVSESRLLFLAESRAPQEAGERQHFSSCRVCRESLSAYVFLLAGFERSETWLGEACEPPGSSDRRSENILLVKRRIDREQELATAVVSGLSDLPSLSFQTEVAKLSSTAGLVRALESASAEARDRRPTLALDLATASRELANALRSEDLPAGLVATLRGQAHKERANALRYLGRFEEALQELDAAEAIFRELAAGDFDLAAVAFVRDQTVDTETMNNKLVHVVRINVVAGYDGRGWQPVTNMTQYAVIEDSGESI